MTINLEALLAEWKQDSVLDKSRLDHEAAKVPYLHAKYVEFFAHAKTDTRQTYNKCVKLRNILVRYYKGQLTREELVAYGWPQYQGKSPLKTELNDLIETDPRYIELETELHSKKTIEETLEYIMKSINSRTWDVKNSIEYLKYINGN